MRVKYRSVPAKAFIDIDECTFDFRTEHLPNLTVFEEDTGPEFTGLVDANGDPICRYVFKQKIGFHTIEDDDDFY